jgi:Zn-dependent alcohol dehydrogenase
MQITAAVVPARSAPFEIQQLELSGPAADEVLVRIVASGMCHTDLHARDGYFANLPYPVVCGHEGAGIVEQVGAAVTDLAPGDPVVISFPWCGECEPCRAERISYCSNARALKSGGRRADGSAPMRTPDGAPVYSCFFQQSSFATFAVAPAKDVVKIRRDAPIDMLGPFGCGLQTGAGAVLNVMQPQAGQSLAVFGVGGVGLAGLMAGKIAGCDPIVAVDRLPARLALARELGATHALESPRDNNFAETLAEIRKITAARISRWRLPPYRKSSVSRSMRCAGSALASWSAAPGPAPRSLSRCRGCRAGAPCAASFRAIAARASSSRASSICSCKVAFRSTGSSPATISPTSTAPPPTPAPAPRSSRC